MAPCLLIFEDLDSLVEEETRSYFLNEVDGLESNEGILMIGSTNHLDRLDAAITKRPSRFDRKYHFRLPDEAERAAYCRYWSQKFTGPIDTGAGAGAGAGGIAAEVDFVEDLCPLIAKMTEGFSFAYLKELFITSLLLLAHANADKNDENDTEQDGEKPAPSHRETTVTPRKKSSWWPSWSRGLLRQPTINKAAVDIEAVGKIKKRDGPSKKGKNGIPAVDIPKHLADHKLLGIVKLQAEVLLEEMDNTGEEEEVENQKSGSFGRLHRIRQRQYDSDDD
jgi:SpoVK/Ycf46/Vps4 family AAA+-type ATPase